MISFTKTPMLSLLLACIVPLFNGASANTTAAPKALTPLQYGSFYTKESIQVPPEHSIPFDHENVKSTPGIEHFNESGDFVIKNPGIYRVVYSVSLKEAGEVALKLDNRVIPGSEMHVQSPDELSTLGMLVRICGQNCCDHVLQVINNYPNTKTLWYSHDLVLDAGSANDVTASIMIERVADCDPACGCN